MDKNAIKKFAVWARTELIARVSLKGVEYGITEDNIEDANADSVGGKVLTADEKKQRQALIAEINDKGYKQVMEEVAYTWFNRFSALRFMEVNGYLPSHVRVFTDEENNFKPQIITEAIHLDLDGLDMEKVYKLKDAEKTEELYKYLLIVQCNALNKILPGMFQKIADYTELLLPDNLLREGSVIQQMIELIPEDDWKDAVQIIGWLYQYYNSEKKDDVFAALKKNVKITKENIPAATQLFTPDWIVRYMVENSLGRLWLEGHPDVKEQLLPTEEEQSTYADGNRESEDTKWHYYLEEAEQEPEVQEQLAEIRKEYATLTPNQLKVIDPCSGSGHILAYMFDVLMKIYESYGYTTREAVASIVENNLYGLDIDDRAAQLAYFAVMMKARQYDRRFFSRGIQPHVYAIVESNHVDKFAVNYFCNGDMKLTAAMDTIIKELHDAKEYGSIVTVTPQDWSVLYDRFAEITVDINMSRDTALRELLPLVQVAEALSQKYDVVVTNPPYLGSSGMSAKLSDYVKKNYPDSKSDLFAVFIEHCGYMAKKNGYQAMITQQVWMFIAGYERLREKLLSRRVVNMLHLGARAFNEIPGEVVQTASFILNLSYISEYSGMYCKLLTGKSEAEKEKEFFNPKQRFSTKQAIFSGIPRTEYIYWVSDALLHAFTHYKKVRDYFTVRNGLTTGDNNRFLRLWFEVQKENIGSKWFPCNKGGTFRRWYGNKDYLIDWENNGFALKNFTDIKTGKLRSTLRNIEFNFLPSVVVGHVASGDLPFRYVEGGFISESAVNSIYPLDNEVSLIYLLGILNSKSCNYISKMLSPTLGVSPEDILNIPIVVRDESIISSVVKNTLAISKIDWDSFETSWDFQCHPLIQNCHGVDNEKGEEQAYIEDAYTEWEFDCNRRFNQIKANEEELNRIFIDIYGLQDELTPEVEDKDVTVRKADLGRDIRSFISYAVGCMFGRYSLYNEGILYAGGAGRDFGSIVDKIQDCLHAQGKSRFPENEFYPDRDNIIPICDDEYFEDDIVSLFVKFVKTVYGADTLEENLDFIASALGNKGDTSREVIRNYFLKDFYADHLKVYQKRPIYWLFDSGKQNGFKALIYMHRYDADTVGRVRTDYLHRAQKYVETAMQSAQYIIENATSASEKSKATKAVTKYTKQLAEMKIYDEAIAHIANKRIEIDLDDGVKVNYEKFQGVEVAQEGKKALKVDLLANLK